MFSNDGKSADSTIVDSSIASEAAAAAAFFPFPFPFPFPFSSEPDSASAAAAAVADAATAVCGSLPAWRGAAAQGQPGTAFPIGVDYASSAPGTDQEFSFNLSKDMSGASSSTLAAGASQTLYFTPPPGTIFQLTGLRYKRISGDSDIVCTSAVVDNDLVLYAGSDVDMSSFSDADPGKRPGLRANPNMTRAQSLATFGMSAVGGAQAVYRVFAFGKVLRDSQLGQRQLPGAR
jgi:hypothetical protein